MSRYIGSVAASRRLTRPIVRAFAAMHYRCCQPYLRWKTRFDPSGVTFRDNSNRMEVSPDLFRHQPRTAVMLAIGASNIANEGSADGRYEPKSGVYNFNFLDGRCYIARDPLLGTAMDRGNLLTRLGDLLVARRIYDQVLLVPIGYGGTFVTEWSPGGRMYPRLRKAIAMLSCAEIRLTHILWQQGEAEGNQPSEKRDEASWINNFAKVENAIRTHKIDVPIFVAQCTICGGAASDVIRKAQKAVVRPDHGILPGPDLDTIGIDQRWDRCHFSVTGMDNAAALWFDAITASNAHGDLLRVSSAG